MKVLVTGAKGMLGSDIVSDLKELRIDHLGIDKEDGDITDCKKVLKIVNKYLPDVIIHCAAYTAVDQAEDDIKLCRNVNVNATKNLLEAAKKINAKFLFISTDYVFDGKKDAPYEIFDNRNPLSIYGKSKMDAENLVMEYQKSFIIRTSWVFGKNGKNFIKTMIALQKENKNISVVDDQVGSPTFTKDLSKAIIKMIDSNKFGIYHVTNEGYISWFDFAKMIFSELGVEALIKPISSDEFPAKASRPMNSKLSKKSLYENGFHKLPDIRDALKRYLKEL
ncbi:dTDP-4-dehydrorhamnose reductase [Acholeplasma sp. OttesenSCG-928-E16]|nr:dTDP-4-dehydrorhamnose reductase [Acholeplasma sp. OttesenSCG-928-E16]